MVSKVSRRLDVEDVFCDSLFLCLPSCLFARGRYKHKDDIRQGVGWRSRESPERRGEAASTQRSQLSAHSAGGGVRGSGHRESVAALGMT